MARIELKGLAHSYGPPAAEPKVYALAPLDLVWEDGRAYALLGPSGCGKTTLLNIISGLLKPSRGAVLIDGADVTAKRPEQRNIAQVFQFPVIYDTMTVAENLAFPLRNRGASKAEAATRVEEIASLLELQGELKHRASGLSADMKQRIALGRGLVRKDVAAILLDEPLTVIDPHVKLLLRRKLAEIHQELRVTLIYVTHDQVEALTLADEVVVMNAGSVVQQGTPQELFESPAHTFVGYFIGSPGMNLLPCEIDGAAAVVESFSISLDPAVCERAKAAGGPLLLGVRPEFLKLTDPSAEGAARAVITEVEDLGRCSIVTARLGELSVKVRIGEGEPARAGDTVGISFPPSWTKLFADGRAVS
jgi:glycerol transport system ATP-binding protein